METETLSSYDTEDKLVLDANTDINIHSDEETSSVPKENNLLSSEMVPEEVVHNNAEHLKVGYKPFENEENEDCGQNITNIEENNQSDDVDSDNETGLENEMVDNERDTIESEDTNKSFSEKVNDDGSNSVEEALSDEERDPLDNEEKSHLNNEERSLSDNDESQSSGEENSPDIEGKSQLNNEEKSPSNNDESQSSGEENSPDNEEKIQLINDERSPLNNDESQSSDEEISPDNEEKIQLNNEVKSPSNEEESQSSGEENSPLNCEKDPLGVEEDDPLSHVQKAPTSAGEEEVERPLINDVDIAEKDPLSSDENQKEEDSLDVRKKLENVNGEQDAEELTEMEKKPLIREGNTKDEIVTNEKNYVKTDLNTEPEANSNEAQKEHKEPSNEDQKNKNDDIAKNCPLLKETLTKVRHEDVEQQKEADGENGMDDIEMDEDFDPSLLCPDIAMEVDEAPVITNNDNVPSDGNKSPLLYEPVFSTYVDEMTGAEVSFNLTPEEQQLRQETYGANAIQYTRIHCTACNVHLGSALDGQSNRFVHPLLKVLICKDCYHFYTSGEFEKDEDGSELYCRWCGQGGQVICCSSCEMVFCKKCIRINFGRKKLTEIRDSEEWLCFRCDTLQLTPLRIHCAEFMEYVRREISRAATLENATSFMTTDYTQCCLSQKKKYVDPHPGEPKKKKRKTSINDPDYDPTKDRPSPPPTPTIVVQSAGTEVHTSTPATSQKPVHILPKPMDPNLNAGIVAQVTQSNQTFKIGNTTYRPRVSTFSQPRPRVQVINPVTTSPAVRAPSSGPGYIKIMPGGIRVHPSPSRNQPAQTFVSSSSRPQSFQRPPRPLGGANNSIKHEWFEKTVRAAARVNSNLSYTLTQLNRAQATATSVEALAVVHNKLQEILSTSINSLIQIRKNLRTEFIAGIKNIRFPPKPPQPQPSTSAQDDDVIFISPTPSPVPPPLLPAPSTSVIPSLSTLNLSPSISITKRLPTPVTPSTSSDPLPSTSGGIGNDRPKVFLRVKSLTALQNVPSECITIPDDPLPPPPPLTPIQKIQEDITIIENSPEKNDGGIVIKDVASVVEKPLQNDMEKECPKPTADLTNGDKEEDKHTNCKEDTKNEIKGSFSFNIKGTPPHELKKMLNTKVYIKRSEMIDDLVKRTFGLTNGDVSE